jgi:hypothetical protein
MSVILEVSPANGAPGEMESLRASASDALRTIVNVPHADAEAARAAERLVHDMQAFVEGRAMMVHLDAEDAAGRQAVRLFLLKVVQIAANLDVGRQEEAIERLADVILPDPLADARGPLAIDNLALRDRFVSETRPLTSVEVAEQYGYKGPNPYATANRWKKSGQIFSVRHRSAEYFPAFQFRDGRPHPAMPKVLKALPARLTPWQMAFWFVSTNGWLDGKAPAETLDDMNAVIAAAQREGQEVSG